MITQDFLKALTTYNENDGFFYDYSGNRLGCLDKSTDYIKMSLLNKRPYAHQLAWLYMTGEWPHMVINHKNGIRNDNRFVNLEHITHQENIIRRTKINKNNSSGIPNLSLDKRRNKYEHYIHRNGKKKHLGYYDSIEQFRSLVSI